MPPMLGNLIKNFPEWVEHSNCMAQYISKCGHWIPLLFSLFLYSPHYSSTYCVAVWTAFCAEGLGCNLQHYQKYLGDSVNAEWRLPSNWVLRAQLVFGTADGPPRGGLEKQFADIEPRLKVFGGATACTRNVLRI
jgi:predicted oxidoreductase (fatty acid repression mutant protein)